MSELTDKSAAATEQVTATAPQKRSKAKSRKPVIDEYEDVFGDPYGRAHSDFFQAARHAVALQGVESLGGRPKDWAKRDLLVQISGDDGRNWFYKKLLKNPSTFLNQPFDVLKHPKKGPGIVRRMRAFDYWNRMFQLEMEARSNPQTPENRAAGAAYVCPTSLYRSNDPIPHEMTGLRRSQVCQNAWVCPHCYGRIVTEQMSTQRRLLSRVQPVFMALLSDGFPIMLDAADQCASHRKALAGQLVDAAKKLGCQYGSVSFQVCPLRDQKLRWNSNEAVVGHEDKLWVRVAVTAFIPPQTENLLRLRASKDSFLEWRESRGPEFCMDLHEFDKVRTLRTMLIGHPRKSTVPDPLEENSFGLFYWPLLTICSPDQWHARFAMTRKQQAVRPWGEWPGRRRTTSPASAAAPHKHHAAHAASNEPKRKQRPSKRTGSPGGRPMGRATTRKSV